MTRPHVPLTLRRRVIERAGGRCEYCLLSNALVTVPHHVDHILPLRHGGVTTAGNLAYACFDCNVDKGANIAAFDPLTGQLTRLYNPRLDVWRVHFALDDGQILGLDAIGRATALLLRFNHVTRLLQRRLLIAANSYTLGSHTS